MTNFEIKLPDSLEKYPGYTPEERDIDEGWTNLEFGVIEFCRRYMIGNYYHLSLGGEVYPLEVYELYIWWSAIPDHLKGVLTDETETQIDIVSSETGFYIVVNPLDEAHISVSIESYSISLQAFVPPIPNAENSQNVAVKREDYIREWWKLVDWTIAHLLNEQLISADDPSLMEYLALMPPRPVNVNPMNLKE